MYLTKFSQNDAKEICKWKYEDIYSIYNFPKWEIAEKQKWGITIKEKRDKEFIGVKNKDNELIGFFRLINRDDEVIIALGIKPEKCGQGLGKILMELVIKECRKRYKNKKTTLEVREFNKRAIKCYKKAGFKEVNRYVKSVLTREVKFIKMEL